MADHAAQTYNPFNFGTPVPPGRFVGRQEQMQDVVQGVADARKTTIESIIQTVQTNMLE